MVKKTSNSKIQNLAFEAALASLQEIVTRMENNQQCLEDSIADYEKGTALVTLCQKQLDEAQFKVEKMVHTTSGRKFTALTPEGTTEE